VAGAGSSLPPQAVSTALSSRESAHRRAGGKARRATGGMAWTFQQDKRNALFVVARHVSRVTRASRNFQLAQRHSHCQASAHSAGNGCCAGARWVPSLRSGLLAIVCSWRAAFCASSTGGPGATPVPSAVGAASPVPCTLPFHTGVRGSGDCQASKMRGPDAGRTAVQYQQRLTRAWVRAKDESAWRGRFAGCGRAGGCTATPWRLLLQPGAHARPAVGGGPAAQAPISCWPSRARPKPHTAPKGGNQWLRMRDMGAMS